jgi:hypothetical protein
MLYRGSDHYGYVYIRTETYIRRRGGHLWWRAWDTGREVPAGFMVLTDGTFDDFIVGSEHLHDEVSDWDSGRFPYRGEAFRVVWLDDDRSARVRADVFGLDTG